MTLPPLTPQALAISDEFYDGSWRDEHGRTLRQAIYAAYIEAGNPNPSKATAELWDAACDLFGDLYPPVYGDETRTP